MKRIKWFSFVRITGLLLVLVYHFFRELLPGGFVGVDVFFTFSGYLITALIIEEFRKTEGFKLGAFYQRRFVRIVPPLLLAIVITLPFALLISPDFTGGIGRQTAGALGFVTNYFEILSGGSYEAQLLPHLLIHTWTLALEMHYYLLWGLLCFLLVFLLWGLVKNKRGRTAALRVALGVISLALAALCFVQMRSLYAANTDNPTAAYFASTSHGFPFFIGSAAAAVMGIKSKFAKKMDNVLTMVGSILGMLVAVGGLVYLGLTLSFSGAEVYQFGFLAASLLTVVFIFAARLLHETTPNRKEPKVITALADMSYSIYLFHWPLYIVFSERMENNLLASLLTLGLSLVFAGAVYYGIEPLFQGKKPWKKAAFLKAFYPVAAAVVVAGLIGSALVFVRAPRVSDLEQGLRNGNVYQDAEGVAFAAKNVQSVKEEPVKNRDKKLSYTDASDDPGTANGQWEPAVEAESIKGGISFIGDSVALGASKLLTKTIEGMHADCSQARSMKEGRELLKEWGKKEQLGDYVVVSLGNNGFGDWEAQINAMIKELPKGCRLVFVTPYAGKPKESLSPVEIAAYYREMAATYEYVTVADWAKIIASRQDLLAADKEHFGDTNRCSQLYVDCVLQGLAEAKEGKAK